MARITGRQPRRLVALLAERVQVATGELARETAIGNLSDAARKAKPELEAFGLTIVAERPKRPILNRYGEKSQQHLWRLAKIH